MMSESEGKKFANSFLIFEYILMICLFYGISIFCYLIYRMSLFYCLRDIISSSCLVLNFIEVIHMDCTKVYKFHCVLV